MLTIAIVNNWNVHLSIIHPESQSPGAKDHSDFGISNPK